MEGKTIFRDSDKRGAAGMPSPQKDGLSMAWEPSCPVKLIPA